MLRERRRSGWGFRLIGLLCLVANLVSCNTRNETYLETRILFDTEVYIEAYGRDAKAAVTKALDKMAKLDQSLNFYDATSELSQLIRSAGSTPQWVSPETFEIIQEAIDIAQITEGSFNPAIGPLVKLWENAGETGRVPTSKEIETLLPLTNFQLIELDSANQTVFLPREGMMLDLGGIAKGYAVEQAVLILEKAGIKSAMVQAGGNIHTIGYKADGTAWRIGIRNPQQTEAVIGYVDIHDTGIDTSGDYERFITINGVKYGHILNPFTGYPPHGVISCSVLADSPVLADALATALVVMGVDMGLEKVNALPGVEVILIDSEGGIHMTAGAEGMFISAGSQ